MKKILIVALMVSVVLACRSQAATVVVDDWDSGTEGWVATNAVAPGNPYGQLSNVGGVLRITGGDADVQPKSDKIFDTDSLLGNYQPWSGTTNIWAVSFQFNPLAGGTNNLPSSLSLYFASTNSVVWYYDITPVEGMNSYFANLFADSGWYSGEHDASFFMADLNAVNEIGILLTYQSNLGGQIYELDNFMLLDAPIPEPETYAVIGFAIFSLAFVFRRRVAESLVRVKAYLA